MTQEARFLGTQFIQMHKNGYDRDLGLTKREYFAGLAMQGLLANLERYKYIAEKVECGMPQEIASAKNAHKAVLLADALLEELSKPE